MIKKISIRSPHSIKAITESDDQFKIIIPSNILNPPNRPFKKRYSHTSKGSLVSVNEVPRNLKYCVIFYLILMILKPIIIECYRSHNGKPSGENP